MEFFFRPWVGPVLAFLALVASYLGRSGVLPREVANVLTILAVSSALASYFARREQEQ
ncbi:MAG: hypothetical protein WBL52_02415 [Bacillota bacterium]|jgi:hypothetical protein|nr:hypothetical protein [Candidatus Fermentithermobacillaceae bacterium]HOA71153.1 hypothetical protein [Bacillota bacterium]HOP71181.1 hypothetical protein [Bacillota bacterium]HPT35132.1 hypothetical protein [Bacillota bacterium]HPZ85646.1 hypothetical protein [Bacillota bacterium]